MNERPGTRFLFITCLTSEVERVYDECPAFRMTDTGWINGYGVSTTKSDSLQKFLHDGVSIAATHKLFSIMNADLLKEFMEKEYVLVCDETIQTIERLPETSKNISFLLRNKALSIGEKNFVSWLDENYLADRTQGYFDDLAVECRKGDVICERDKSNYILMRYMNPV